MKDKEKKSNHGALGKKSELIQKIECGRCHGGEYADHLIAPIFRTPFCARAIRPDKEHVSMAEEMLSKTTIKGYSN